MSLSDEELRRQLADAEQTARWLQAQVPAIRALGERLRDAIASGNKILTCGNGGSAAEAAHFATELLGRYKSNRPALPAVALNADGSLLTCIGNDFGFAQAFARQVEGLGRPGDVLALFTSSGNSENLVAAVEAAHRCGVYTAAFLGKDGGILHGKCDWEILLPFSETARVQEGHLMVVHLLSELLEK